MPGMRVHPKMSSEHTTHNASKTSVLPDSGKNLGIYRFKLTWTLFLRKDVGQRCCQRCALQESLDVRTCFPCWAENSMCLGSVQAGCEGSCWAGSLDGAEALLPLTAEALWGLSASGWPVKCCMEEPFPCFLAFIIVVLFCCFFYGLLWYWKPCASIIHLG